MILGTVVQDLAGEYYIYVGYSTWIQVHPKKPGWKVVDKTSVKGIQVEGIEK